MFKTLAINTEEEMLAYAETMARATQAGAIIFLQGPLGAGKTTFTRGFLRALGYQGKVKSPTFSLVECYELNGRSLFHFDFYRLHQAKELEEIGIKEYFDPETICLIEWPERGFPLLPVPDVVCDIAFTENGREMKVEAKTKRGEGIINRIGFV